MSIPSISNQSDLVGRIFLWEVKTMKNVLVKFKVSLFALSQSFTRGSSEFIIWNRFSWDLWEIKIFESSANNSKCIDNETLGRSFINNRNNSGPKMEPWGTPYLIRRSDYILLLHWTCCCLLSR